MKKLLTITTLFIGSIVVTNAQPPLPPHPAIAGHHHQLPPHPPLPPRPPHPPLPPHPHRHVVRHHRHVVRHHRPHRPVRHRHVKRYSFISCPGTTAYNA